MRAWAGSIVIALAVIVAPVMSRSQDIGSMSCIQVRTLLDNPSTTPGEMAPIFNYIQGRLLADDDSWVADGHDPVAQKWDEKGVRNSIATVTATCASNRDDTIDQRTDAVFEGFAQLAVMLGVAK